MEILISVENFQDGGLIREINSPRTLAYDVFLLFIDGEIHKHKTEACLRSGLDPADLAPKPRSAFESKKLTKEMVDVKQKVAEDKRKDRIALVKSERDAIIRYAEKQLARTSLSPNKDEKGFGGPKKENAGGTMVELDMQSQQEEKRMEALKRRQEKELSKMIEKEQAAALLQQKIKKAEDEEVLKKKHHEKKVAEQKAAEAKKQIQRANDLKRQEEEEAAKKREMDKKEAEFERKRQKAAEEAEKKLLAEARQREVERAEKMEQNRLKTEALIQAQFDVAEQNRIKMLEREKLIQQQLEEKKERKKQEVQESREAASKRILEALHKHHELHEAAKQQYEDRQRLAQQRAKEAEMLEREKLKKQADDREKRNKQRTDRLVDAYRTRAEYRKSVIDRRSEKDQVFSKIQEEREKEIAMMKFSAELKFEDKMDNVERVSRVHEFQRLQSLRRIEEQEARYNSIQEKKAELAKKHLEEVKASLTRKHEIAEAMNTMRITNDFSMLDKLFAKKSKKEKRGGKQDDGDGDERAVHTAP